MLEGRTLFSDYSLAATLHDATGVAGEAYGFDTAAHGNLVLIGTNTKGNGEAQLVDATTGSLVRTFSNPDSTGAFGEHVAFFDDGKIAISSVRDTDNSGEGVVWVYDNASDITPTAITNPFPSGDLSLSNFGENFTTYGNTLLIATNKGSTGDGEVEQFDVSGNLLHIFAPPSGGNGNDMGRAMAVSGDNILIAGTSGPQIAGASHGVVWEFDGATGDLINTIEEPAANLNDAHQFGLSVAFAGSDILVSAPSDDFNNFIFEGGFVYQFHADGSYVRTYSNPEGVLTGQQFFGQDLAVNGDKVMVTASGQLVDSMLPELDENGDPVLDGNGDPVFVPTPVPAGKAFVFDYTTGDLEATIANPNPPTSWDQPFSAFGFSASSLDNGGFVVADYQNDAFTGVAYVYSPNVTSTNEAPTADAGADRTVAEGSTVNFDGSASTDPDGAGDIVSYEWDLNYDGVTFDVDASGATTSVTYNDNGSHTVALRVSDSEGHTSIDSASVTVQNVGPNASISGAPASSNEGAAISLSGSANDPSSVDTAAGFTFAWSVTKNGNAYATGSGASFSFTPNDNGTYVVSLLATDKDGGAGSDQKTITVNNVGPSASIAGAPASSNEGSAISVSGSATDASSADMTAGFGLGWSVTKNGNAYATGSGANFSFTPNDNGTYVITLTATDKDGGTGSTSSSITVNNVAPTVSVSGPSSGTASTPLSFSSTVSDPGSADTQSYAWTAMLGSTVVATGTGAGFTFTPTTAGAYTVSLVVTDDDGGSGSASANVSVSPSSPPPPNVGGAIDSNGNLVVTGSSGIDVISVTKNGNNGVRLTIGGQTTNFNPTGRIIINAGDGNDIVQIGTSITQTAEVHGGNGIDSIAGGNGDDILLGDAGDDLLVGGNGRDLLIGGTGTDVIVGNTDDDILVAGNTAYDNNSAMLLQVQSIWLSNASYLTRVNTLRNGIFRPDTQIYDDGAADILTGDQGQDWFVFNDDSGVRDIVTDIRSNEIATDVDFINSSMV